MTEPIFVDSNVAMYAVGKEHPYRRPCQEALRRIAEGEVQAVVDCEVHQEILHRYLSLRLPEKAQQISLRLEVLIPHTLPITSEDIARARQLVDRYPDLPARDLLHVAVMLNHGITRILSADAHFDQVEEVERIDPLSFAAESELGS
ncbi:MAG TPA: PIN domain-containing protein [Chloroflexi bacterium]|nr:PIN domain-containing protein [Chloroflexota bacterium]